MPASEIMHKFYHGTLHSGSSTGPKVTKLSQAKAIAASYSNTSDKRSKKEHKKNNSDRHAHLGPNGSVMVSHHDVCSKDMDYDND